ncbi:interleukin-9 receptor-like isoform X4 [Hemicordylus capensis]|uniref:interleukin-9 receptor-like isoform X4 n=1 Tax=Hemicordylus capensis TaxID=884348 RepID=UPI002302108B|nr:interleukin-9 receptor-like isoform X4 [Hemicordylus capensis]
MEQSRGAAWLLLLLLLLLLQTLLLPSSLAAERQQAGSPGTARCRNSYGSQKRRVDCVWHPNQALGDGPFYLNFSDLLSTESSSLLCKLSASSEMPPVSSCSVTGEGEFMENDQYHVSLHDASLGTEPLYTIFSDYEPMKHIQSDPPFALESSMSASKCRIQWKRPEAYDVLLETVLQWELAFKAADAPWEQAQSKILDHSETWVELEGAEFKSRVSYVARIRCKISDSERHYRSEWSPWSPTTTWTAPPPGPRAAAAAGRPPLLPHSSSPFMLHTVGTSRPDCSHPGQHLSLQPCALQNRWPAPPRVSTGHLLPSGPSPPSRSGAKERKGFKTGA